MYTHKYEYIYIYSNNNNNNIVHRHQLSSPHHEYIIIFRGRAASSVRHITGLVDLQVHNIYIYIYNQVDYILYIYIGTCACSFLHPRPVGVIPPAAALFSRRYYNRAEPHNIIIIKIYIFTVVEVVVLRRQRRV
jgi:hypothetical protein